MLQKYKNVYHLLVTLLANCLYRFPSRRLTVIGVTGTDGKTTTVNLIYHLLKTAGYDVSMISTTGATINGHTYGLGFHVTTPSAFVIQKFLKKAGDQPGEKKKYMVLEVTSHAIDQHRIEGIHFTFGVLTNVTNEHLDYHKTYDNYVKTKAKLLAQAKTAIVNRDDSSYKIIKNVVKNKRYITYGMKAGAEVIWKQGYKTYLIGEFNKYNILAAVAVCKELGVDETIIKKGIETFEAPVGRQEFIYNNGYKVIIDFAHTPNAFEQLLPDIRKLTKKRLIHVFGAAARRDTFKRPQMGKISSEYADIIILTAEDSRDEPIEQINKAIARDIDMTKFQIAEPGKLEKTGKYVVMIPDRRKAIFFAIYIAEAGDVVLLTGKGHEQSINYGKGEEPWSEFAVATEALEEKHGKK